MLILEDLKISKKKIFIYGITQSSFTLMKFLVDNEVDVFVWDKSSELLLKYQNKEELNNKYIEFKNIKDVDLESIEYFVLAKDFSEDFDLENIKNKIVVETEFFYQLFKENNYIGIFGDSGKLFIIDLIRYILKEAKINNIDFNTDFNNILKFKNLICPVLIPLNMIKYLKNIEFSTLIMYEFDEEKFNSEEKLNNLYKNFLNKNENFNLILNIDDPNLKEIYEKLTNNEEFLGNLIAVSITKILDVGISYINGTVYNYFNKNNLNLDVAETEYTRNDFGRLASLLGYVCGSVFNINNEELISYIKNFDGVANILEYIKEIENVKFINNIWADTGNILKIPFDFYENIYTLLVVRNSDYDLKYFLNKSTFVFVIDENNFVKKMEDKKLFIFKNMDEAFNKAISFVKEENKEDKITILLTADRADEQNCVFYLDKRKNFMNLINGLD